MNETTLTDFKITIKNKKLSFRGIENIRDLRYMNLTTKEIATIVCRIISKLAALAIEVQSKFTQLIHDEINSLETDSRK